MRVLHVLHHSTPHLDGYGVRSQSIVRFQHEAGLLPAVLTSAHHEIEVHRDGQPAPPLEVIDGIRYHRTALASTPTQRVRLSAPVLRERLLMRLLDRSLERVLDVEPFDVIHAHSPVLCGLPALRAARRRGIPLVYEVRAFWEDAATSTGGGPINATKYWFSRTLETSLFKRADAVVAISQYMIDEIAGRGIDRSTLHKVPNGVDEVRFTPRERDTALAAALGISGRPVVAFIGSFFAFEGLDCLVRSMPQVLARVPDAVLMLVGTGDVADQIRRLVRSSGLERSVIQPGRVPHDDVLRYYSVADVMVYPRHRDRLTELVTPLKPLEALAVGRAVIGSDVGGIKELLDDGRAGVLFRAGDSEDLARHIVNLLTNPAARSALASEGLEYVKRERSWSVLARRYVPIYAGLAGSKRSPAFA